MSRRGALERRLMGSVELKQRIGSGSFGEIYRGSHVENGNTVAVKVEVAVPNKKGVLRHEYKVLKVLQSCVGVPRNISYGTQEGYNFLTMDLLGPNVEELFERQGRRFSLKTVLMLGQQCLERLEAVHSCGIIHRDVKPDNFLIGKDDLQMVYCIDFGLSKQYQEPRTGRHMSIRYDKSLVGTARYASIRTHEGVEPSRRDDLESLGYVLVYFLRGSLPWSGLPGKTKAQKYWMIHQKKMSTPLEQLCENLPDEFITYLKYVRTLGFAARPDYHFLRKLFSDLFNKLGHTLDWEFDWIAQRAN